jgi:hypothetical protein
MNIQKIKKINDNIRKNKEKLKLESGNSKNQQIIRLRIKIDELQIAIERLSD